MHLTSILFCVVSLAVSLGVAALLFPHTTLSEAQLRDSRTAVPAWEMGEVDLGDFGTVSVQDLVDYYVENPPSVSTEKAVVRKVRFQGC